jgi:hypothetical protein
VLLRGIGPGLAQFGVAGVAAAPELVLFGGDERLAGNTDWRETAAANLASLAAQVGAFALAETDADSALSATLPPGAYTVHLRDQSRAGGGALIEVYDTGDQETSTTWLSNLSTQAQLAGGDDALIAGMVVQGEQPQRVLLRAVGPGLAAHGVTDPVVDPWLGVYAGERIVAQSAAWHEQANAAAIAEAATATGAFALAADDADSALLLTLPPGPYTLEAKSATGQTGRVLVEVYAVEE